MRLIKFEAKNYGSIKKVSIEECGNFNVFIGKNNSGLIKIYLVIFFVWHTS